jgi:hypothetical protein
MAAIIMRITPLSPLTYFSFCFLSHCFRLACLQLGRGHKSRGLPHDGLWTGLVAGTPNASAGGMDLAAAAAAATASGAGGGAYGSLQVCKDVCWLGRGKGVDQCLDVLTSQQVGMGPRFASIVICCWFIAQVHLQSGCLLSDRCLGCMRAWCWLLQLHASYNHISAWWTPAQQRCRLVLLHQKHVGCCLRTAHN